MAPVESVLDFQLTLEETGRSTARTVLLRVTK